MRFSDVDEDVYRYDGMRSELRETDEWDERNE